MTGYDPGMARHPLLLFLVAIGLLLPGTAQAQPPPAARRARRRLPGRHGARPPDRRRPGARHVAPGLLRRHAGCRRAERRGRRPRPWSSASNGFVAAGAGDPGILDGGGGLPDPARFTDCWRQQSVSAAALATRTRLTLRGRLTGSRGGASAAGPLTDTATLQPAGARRLRLTVRLRGVAAANAIMLSSSSVAGESVHGFGAQTRWNLKGHEVAVLTREQGVGRGDPLITQAQNAQTPPQGADEDSTYAVVPQYLTSRDRGLFLTDTEYSAFDLRRSSAIRTQLWSRALHAQILRGESPGALIRSYTEYAGRMRPMPAWVDRGAIVGIQGGTDIVRQRVADLQAAGVPLAGVWLQDWVGQRVTNFGSRLRGTGR